LDKRHFTALATVAALGAAPALAATITVSPGDAPVAESPPFGAVVGVVGTSSINFGLDFSWGGDEGVFSDPPLAWGGVNADGKLDLVSPVDGRIVVQGTTTQGVTDYFYAEAGFADDGALTLKLFDIFLNEIASILNGPPLGDNGRTTFQYSGPGIAYFRISGGDTFGVDQIRLNAPVPAGDMAPIPAPIPLPAGGLLLLGALASLGALRRRA
jgi:hypothetical protein